MKKTKIAYFNGSNRVNGNTSQAIQGLLDLLKKDLAEEIEVSDLSAMSNVIKMCSGCFNCFHGDTCSLNDSMIEIREKLLDADLIILATPVYLKAVSGYMKIFLDRLSSWTHLQRLLGKRCIIMVTTQNSGVDSTAKYLYEVASHMGLDVIGSVWLRMINNDVKVVDQLKMVADKYARINYYNIKSCANVFRVGIFENLKLLYTMQKENGIHSYEVKYWIENKYFDKNLEEILDEL